MHNEHTDKKHEDHGHANMVTLTVDGKEVQVQKGTYQVADLKAKLGIPAEYEFDLVEGGQFRPLDDNASVEIEKPAIFVSHVRCGASSSDTAIAL